MGTPAKESFQRPNWRQVSIWNGAGIGGLWRLLRHNRFQVDARYVSDCLIDLVFGCGNSVLGGIQHLLYSKALRRLELQQDPIFILGHWRTGTTLVHELLSLDPNHIFPTTFQCFAPCHFLITEKLLKPWTGFTLPAQRPPDQMQMGWDLPQEDEFALCNLGIPSPYAMIAFPNRTPMDQQYLDLSVSQDELRRWESAWLTFLKGVQYRCDKRIVLKSPTHTFRIPTIVNLFPQAVFIYLVRHPHEVFLSTVRLWKSLFAGHGYQQPTFEELEEYVLGTFLHMHERFQATKQLIPPGRLHTLRFEDVVSDTTSEIRRLYETAQLGDFSRMAPELERYQESHRDYQRSHYEVSQELKSRLYERWRGYFEAHDYDSDSSNS